MNVTTIVMMPDDKHLFVSAEGAGYIIDLASRTLVEDLGPNVAGVLMNEQRTLFLVEHDGMRLEAFGKNGRLWKTDTISFKGFRDTAVTDTSITSPANRATQPALGGPVFRSTWRRGRFSLGRGERCCEPAYL